MTLTYRDGVAWNPAQCAGFWHRVRAWYRRQRVPFRYVWTMELTARGRPHYHALLWVPRHLMLPKPDRRGWWPHGMTRTETARNAVGYIAKYASKGTGGHCDPETGDEYLYPARCRISGGTLLRDGAEGAEWRYWTAPRWARDLVEPGTDLRRCTGGVVVVATGELLETPWRLVLRSGHLLVFEARAA